MTVLPMLALVCGTICALVPAGLFCANLRLYREPGAAPSGLPSVSILIPARNEAHGIGDAVRAALASTGTQVEVVVMDDGSTDDTASIVQALAMLDARVRLEHAPPLPAGWNGKQHACWVLGRAAQNPLLCFVDADVRLAPECVARMAGLLQSGDNGLVSGFPRQITGTWMEWMLLPLIHFVLLGFLPLGRMRRGTDPGFAAGCGQFMMARADRYFACGGHSAIKLTMHDGLLLTKRFRESGFRTDLADLTHLATCRMYTTAAQVWNGLAKNATEGLGAPAMIVPITILFLLGQVLPYIAWLGLGLGFFKLLASPAGQMLLTAAVHDGFVSQPRAAATVFMLGTVCTAVLADWIVRGLAARRFRQDWRGALLHPIGILLLLAIQWYALIRKLSGRAVSWRDRAYAEQ